MGNIIRNPQKWVSTSSTNYKKPKCAKRSSTRLGIELIHNPYSTSNKRTSKREPCHSLPRKKQVRKEIESLAPAGKWWLGQGSWQLLLLCFVCLCVCVCVCLSLSLSLSLSVWVWRNMVLGLSTRKGSGSHRQGARPSIHTRLSIVMRDWSHKLMVVHVLQPAFVSEGLLAFPWANKYVKKYLSLLPHELSAFKTILQVNCQRCVMKVGVEKI